MAMDWTPDQRKVIDLRERSILVSAAAGSGKTAVLVERIVGLLSDEKHPVDIDRLLVVTFTKAAAGEMRERITAALDNLLLADPENEHLQRQQTLICNAQITTIDSFCNDVLRSSFHQIGLDPNYRVGDEGELKLLKNDVAEALLEEKFEEKDPAFLRFVESFATGRDDREIGGLILRLYEFSMSHPWPLAWLDSCVKPYEAESLEEMLDAPWMAELLSMLQKLLNDVLERIDRAVGLCLRPGGPWMYEDALKGDRGIVEGLLAAAGDYASLSAAFAGRAGYPRLSGKKDPNVSEESREEVKNLRKQIKDTLDKLEEQYFFAPPEALFADMTACRENVRVLTGLTAEFSGRFAAAKREKNLLDFSDMEHLALQILVEKKDGENVPTEAARELACRYEEIMIDEYQDSNEVQELILNAVSGAGRGKKNLFMVGDVKQSIYRFRMARPELFMEKYARYSVEPGPEQRIDLSQNFRSRAEVLDAVNFVFERLMTKKMGGILYDDAAALHPGAVYPPAEGPAAEMLLLDLSKEPEAVAEAEENARELEARMAGQKLLSIVGKEKVYDRAIGGMRKARFSDCVILLRTVSGWGETFLRIFSDMGIPAYAGTRTGYFSATEIQTVLAFLKVLDNPRQDIALAAVLASPIGGFSSRELALIRAAEKESDFYTACRSYAKGGAEKELREKTARFFAMVDDFRKCVGELSMHELLWQVYDRTGYASLAAAMPGGAQRAANLRMLEEQAENYEKTSYRGLYNFVRYIENLKKAEVDYGEAGLAGDGDTVQILSIHKSKGLEFPVVFLCGMQKNFNRQDERSALVLHPDLGLGCDYADPKLRYRIPLLLKRVLSRRIGEDNLSEELRVLYVALTRAKERLIMTGCVTDPDAAGKGWEQDVPGPEGLSYTALSGAKCYLDWVMPVLLSCGEPLFALTVQTIGDLAFAESREQLSLHEAGERLLLVNPEETVDTAVREQIKEQFASVYPYEAQLHIGAKLTVSELKKRGMEPEELGEELFEEAPPTPWIPAFMREEREEGGAARGTLYHSFLEHLDYTRADSAKEIGAQLAEFARQGFCTERESRMIRPAAILDFVRSPIGQRMRAAALCGTLHREQPFVAGLPAGELRPEWEGGGTVLLQGMIDAWFEEDGELVLVDYKTDYTEDPTGNELYQKYAAQLFYYKKALEQLKRRPVKEAVIYSFHLRREIRRGVH